MLILINNSTLLPILLVIMREILFSNVCNFVKTSNNSFSFIKPSIRMLLVNFWWGK